MNYCPFEDAFKGKPYEKDIEPIMTTYHVDDKKYLMKTFDKKQVKNVSDDRKIIEYETPLIMVNQTSFIEGKWRDNPTNTQDLNGYKGVTSGINQNFPFPFMQGCVFPDNKFLPKLKQLMNDKKKYAVPYNHVDQCRLCFKPLSNMEYVIQKNDLSFRVYESNLHYYMRHNVWPSKKLYKFIMSY